MKTIVMAVIAALALAPFAANAQGKGSAKSQKSTARQHGHIESTKGHGKVTDDTAKKKHGVMTILKGHGKLTNPSSHDSVKSPHGKNYNPSLHDTVKKPHGKSTADHGKYHNPSSHDTTKKK